MKKLFLLSIMFFIFFIFVINIYAQELKIIDIKGDVLLRQREIFTWKEAKVGDILYNDYELLTKEGAECTLSFDEDLNRVFTLKENSQIKISDVLGGNIELSKGRAFSLIQKIEKQESFRIRTPVAITGPRGTGMGVGFNGSSASALCFEGIIYVEGLDEKGNKVSEKDIAEGFGVEVFKGGIITDTFTLTGDDLRDWDIFKGNLDDLIGSAVEKESPILEEQQIREEQRDDFRQETIRELRDQQETDRGGQIVE